LITHTDIDGLAECAHRGHGKARQTEVTDVLAPPHFETQIGTAGQLDGTSDETPDLAIGNQLAGAHVGTADAYIRT